MKLKYENSPSGFVYACLSVIVAVVIFNRLIHQHEWLGLLGWVLAVVLTYIANEYRNWWKGLFIEVQQSCEKKKGLL